MDWGRAKNIILVVLVLLNIFLFVNVIGVKDPFNITGRYQKDAKQALQAAGIEITGRIPSSRPIGRVSYIEADPMVYADLVAALTKVTEVTTVNQSDGVWQSKGKALSFQGNTFLYTEEDNQEILPVDNEKKLDRKLKAWIREKSISKDVFALDSLVQNGNTTIVEYIRYFRNMPLFSQKIIFTIVDQKLRRVEGSLKILEEVKLSTNTDEVLSPNIVLLTGKDKVQGTVQSIDLGYLSLQEEDLYDTPVWRITLATGEKVWFNAFTGEYLKRD